ncbi:alkaline-phosphatase-like protein [Phakopsora pachyrhizi]|nr:alkaline-phosphatase-like protein [Phakopsora pachyrhizi]
MVRSRKASVNSRSSINLLQPSSSSSIHRTITNRSTSNINHLNQNQNEEEEEEDNDNEDQQAHRLLLTSNQPEPERGHDHGFQNSSDHELRPLRRQIFIINCLIGIGLLVVFTLLAPLIGSTVRSLRQNFSPTKIKVSNSFRPTGPPGSITQKTEHWAQQGGDWKVYDPSTGTKERLAELDGDDDQKVVGVTTISNGTHLFKPTVILVSFDGFRPDYLDRNLTPTLSSLANGGLKTTMKPTFPSLTFPNHWSMMTGLYPESHGIVANNFFDPRSNSSFDCVDPQKSWDSSWWFGQPIWEIAIRRGLKVAISMWPGPPYSQNKVRPTIWRPYADRFKWWKKIGQLESWLDLPIRERPQFMALYMPELDQVGHHYGPNHLKLNKALEEMDRFVESLRRVLETRHLDEIVDLVFVSDHGMASSDDSRVLYLDEILGKTYYDQIKHRDGWPLVGLRFEDGLDTRPILSKLLKSLTLKKFKGTFNVYTNETMPNRYHFSKSDRIAPIYIIPKKGWVISDTYEHRVQMNGKYKPKGIHGYDNEDEEMGAIFISTGPFSKQIRAKQEQNLSKSLLNKATTSSSFRADKDEDVEVGVLKKFANLEVFSLVGKLLGLDSDDEGLERIYGNSNCSFGFWDQYF